MHHSLLYTWGNLNRSANLLHFITSITILLSLCQFRVVSVSGLSFPSFLPSNNRQYTQSSLLKKKKTSIDYTGTQVYFLFPFSLINYFVDFFSFIPPPILFLLSSQHLVTNIVVFNNIFKKRNSVPFILIPPFFLCRSQQSSCLDTHG